MIYVPPWAESIISTLPDVIWVGRYEEEDKLAAEFEDLVYEKQCPAQADLSFGMEAIYSLSLHLVSSELIFVMHTLRLHRNFRRTKWRL